MPLEIVDEVILINNQMVLVLVCIKFLVNSLSAGKSNIRLIQQAKEIMTIEQIKNLIEKMDDWYFIKLEIIQFFIIVYINNPRLEDKEKGELFLFMKEVVVKEIDNYINGFEALNNRHINFFSNVHNIFQQTNIYNTQ